MKNVLPPLSLIKTALVMSVTQTNNVSMMLLALSLYQTHKSAQFIVTADLTTPSIQLAAHTIRELIQT